MPKDRGRPAVAAKDKKVQRNIYPTASLWARIEQRAEAERRPVAQMVVLLLEDAMDQPRAKSNA